MKKYNETQLTKYKMNLNNRKNPTGIEYRYRTAAAT